MATLIIPQLELWTPQQYADRSVQLTSSSDWVTRTPIAGRLGLYEARQISYPLARMYDAYHLIADVMSCDDHRVCESVFH